MTTQINTDSTTDEGMPLSKFTQMLNQDGGREYARDFDSHRRLEFIRNQVTSRNGAKAAAAPEHEIPNQFVIQQAAERYFFLVNVALTGSLTDLKFSREEITIVLNTTCDPVWQWAPWESVAAMVADDNGVEDLEALPPDSTIRLLIEKLIPLTQLQNAALVDFGEKFWRARSDRPFDELCAGLGLELAD